MLRCAFMLALCGTLALCSDACAAEGVAHDSTPGVLLILALMIAVALLAGELVSRLGQPAVLGELLAGIVLGNLGLLGFTRLEPIQTDPMVGFLAQLGVILLLFEVGLESTVREMLRVGASSFLVALLGVATPFALGWGVGRLAFPHAGSYVHAFLGAALTATSVGITARVLKDLNRSRSGEGRVILGAAVIDDILGLVILSVLTGLIQARDRGSSFSFRQMALVLGKALFFLGDALVLGVLLAPRLFKLASKLRVQGVLLGTSLAICFFLAYVSSKIGLSPIVGAFAAGLILENVHFRDFTERGEVGLEDLLRPFSEFLAPIFFVLMGMRVDLRVLGNAGTLGLAALLTLAAIAGKQACSAGVLQKGVDRLAVGIGMIPRGEVGLIYASIGVSLTLGGNPLISREIYAGVVIMVIATTMMTPPLLKWRLGRRGSPADGADPS